jgi:hypothetical protein
VCDAAISGFMASTVPLDAGMPLASYGSDAVQIEDLMRQGPDLARPLHPALPITGAQVVWAARPREWLGLSTMCWPVERVLCI